MKVSSDGQFNNWKSIVFDSFSEVPPVWGEICGNEDLAMDINVLRVFQHTLSDQCRCWGVIVYDESGAAAGCAALCMFQTEIIDPPPAALIKLRRFLPWLGKMNVLFCGLPVPSGSTHFCVRDSASMQAVVREVDMAMKRLAKLTKSRLTVFKELDNTTGPLADALSAKGYIPGMIPPMHMLNVTFKNFAQYRDSLKSRYRAQVQRSQKKLVAAGFEVLFGRGQKFFTEHFNEQVYQLYVAVQSRAKQKLELMPESFFRGLAIELGDEVLLTLIRKDGKVCAFTFSITRWATHYNLYSGLDYTLNNDGDLYFNLFYNDLDQAFQAGATSLHLGQTSDSFKSRLGSITQKLWFFARVYPPALNGILRLAAPLAFPKVDPVEPNDVFTGGH